MAGTDVVNPLPIRTVSNGDVVVFIADATTPSQLTTVDTHGSLSSILKDTAGNAIGDQLLSATYWLQTVSPSNGSAAPGTSSAFADLIAGQFNTALPTLTNGQQSALQANANGILFVDLATSIPAGANNIGSVNQGTSPWITKDQSDGPVTPGTVASFSQLIGAQYNTSLPTLTTGQQSALQADSSGRIIISPLTTASVIKVDLQDGAGTAISSQTINAAQWLDVTVPYNGVIGAAVPVDAAYIAGRNASGNLQGIATDSGGNLNANVYVGGNPNTSLNPVFVTLTSSSGGTAIHYYNPTAVIAINGTDATSVYTITATKTLSVEKIWISSTARIRADFQISPDGSTYTTIFTGFNSANVNNIPFDTNNLAINDSGSGSTVRVFITNEDSGASHAASAYVTILGVEN